MLSELSIKEFLNLTASNSPVPGGGSVAALSAAIAAALSGMVANLTIGKTGFEDVETRMIDILAKAENIRNKMVRFIDKDSDAFNEVMDAYRMPKNNSGEKEKRLRSIENTLKKAARIPLEVAHEAYKIMDLAESVVVNGNKNAITDGAVGAMCARTAVLAGIYNVRINLDSIKDKEFVEELSAEIEQLETDIEEKEKMILSKIMI